MAANDRATAPGTGIMLTCPCNEDPLIPPFYTVKLGFTGLYIMFYLCSKIKIVGTR